MVAEAWLIWGMIGRFKAGKVTVSLVVVITLADGTGGSVLVIALIGAFLVLLLFGWLATGGSAARVSLVAARGMYQQDTVFCCFSLHIWRK